MSHGKFTLTGDDFRCAMFNHQLRQSSGNCKAGFNPLLFVIVCVDWPLKETLGLACGEKHFLRSSKRGVKVSQCSAETP